MAASASQTESDAAKLAELAAVIQAVKDRVRARYPQHSTANSEGDHPPIQIPLADLLPILHARDAAQARVAAIGSVNPRAGGLVNRLIQAIKHYISRALGWFVRDQVTFNREAVSAIEAILEALNDQNRSLVSLAAQMNEQIAHTRGRDLEKARELAALVETRHREALASLQMRVDELLGTIESRARELSHKIDLRGVELVAKGDVHARDLSNQIEARAREIHLSTDPLPERLESYRSDLSKQIEARAHDLSKQIDARFYELNAGMQPYIQELDPLKAEAAELKDIRKHWLEWRTGWEHKLATNEVYFLRAAAELQGAFQHRVGQIESTFRDIVKSQHGDYLGALDRANLDIQKRLWADLEKIQADYERLIHTELRLIRLRGAAGPVSLTPPPAAITAAAAPLGFDYSRFAERFRGSDEYVRRNQEFYLRFFQGREDVLDIGCGRGEFLSVMGQAGIKARGIDLGAESVSQCRAKGLEAEEADLFVSLSSGQSQDYDGIFSAQVVEHIDPMRLPEMIRLCAANLRRGGVLAIETPNPECLAIFASHFFLDPTHTRPVPSPLLSFYMEEAGLGAIEIHRMSPAVQSMPELAELPEGFRNRFFGGLDYAIVAYKL